MPTVTPRDSESVLNRLSRLEREATPGPWEQDGLADVFQVDDNGGAIVAAHYDADAALIVLSRNHLRALLDVARAAERVSKNGARMPPTDPPIVPDELDDLRSVLRPLTTPSEQSLQTESESRGVAPPCKGVEEGSA